MMRAIAARHAIAMLGWTLVACAPTGSEAAERRSDTTGRRDSIAAAAAASMSEGQVLGLLAATQADDSALGALGAVRGSSQDVKGFAGMILREHHALRLELFELGKQLGVAVEAPTVPPDEPSADARRMLDAAKAGPAWDRAYLDYTITVHQSAFENTARALAATKRTEVRQQIDRSVPILQKHLDKAKALQKSIGTAQSPVKPKSDSATIAKKGAPLTGAHRNP